MSDDEVDTNAAYDLNSRRESLFVITKSELKRVPSIVNLEAHKVRHFLRNLPRISILSFQIKVIKSLKKSPVYDPFSLKSFVSFFASIGLYLSDYGSDIVVAVLLYKVKTAQKCLKIFFKKTNFLGR